MVEAMTVAGIEQVKIARVLGCTEKTMRKHFREELDTAAEKALAQVGQSLFQAAFNAVSYKTIEGPDGRPVKVVDEIRPAGITAGIWITKARGRWKGTDAHEVGGKGGGPLVIHVSGTDADL